MDIPKIILENTTLITDWGTRGRYNTSPGVEREFLEEVFDILVDMYRERGFDIEDY